MSGRTKREPPGGCLTTAWQPRRGNGLPSSRAYQHLKIICMAHIAHVQCTLYRMTGWTSDQTTIDAIIPPGRREIGSMTRIKVCHHTVAPNDTQQVTGNTNTTQRQTVKSNTVATQLQLNCKDTSALYTSIFHGCYIPPGSPRRGCSNKWQKQEDCGPKSETGGLKSKIGNGGTMIWDQ